MLPSILAHEVRESTRRFLVGAYEPADAFFHGIVERFVAADDGLDKGPYLQLGLPFRPGSVGQNFFSGFQLDRPGYKHQEAAWMRLASDRGAANTLVATGTGSGKTECFLYPILDHCVRSRAANEAGIKALIIYPMNALASDQARRFAEVIANTPEFKGLRVGLYVGGGKGRPGSGTVMTAESVITDRDTLRRTPPDVLLTNYKMLDYLLIRPKDRALWAGNGPETLRYIVVDELHTFDGAQGTDLAMLLRRLRARLRTPEGGLICAGTSATLGDGDTAPLRDYAHQIFAGDFPPESVVTESRDSISEFLGDGSIEFVLQDRADFEDVLNPARYRSQQAVVAAWYPVFFDGADAPKSVDDWAWRSSLGAQLKQHLLFHNLLRASKGGVISWHDLGERLAGPLPSQARRHVARVLEALIALIAWARDPADSKQTTSDRAQRPLLTVRVQLWMRELRRLVASVTADPVRAQLRWAADLKAGIEGVNIPLVQCSECHSTGWLARRPASATSIDQNLEHIYNSWFQSAPEVCRLYPAAAIDQPRIDARRRQLCGQCGALQDAAGRCGDCGTPDPVAVWEILDLGQSTRDGVVYRWHRKDCPACGAEDRLLLLGARNATLAAQMIEQSWATPFNDDKKLIAFSDSVQDAALRAGFFGSRTYANNVRMAMAQTLAHADLRSFPWFDFLNHLPACWLHSGGPKRMTPEEYVTEFIGPNMVWQNDWTKLQDIGVLESDGRLLERVRKRLGWQAVADFTYLSRRGRTLDRLGIGTLSPPANALADAGPRIANTLRESFGMRHLSDAQVMQWLWGFLIYLRQRGAVSHPEMASYAQNGGLYNFMQRNGRDLWLPPMSPFGPHPKFLTLGKHRDFDRLTNAQGRSWYQQWLLATLGSTGLLPADIAEPAYLAALDVLIECGVLVSFEGPMGRAIGLDGSGLQLQTDTVWLYSSDGHRTLTVDRGSAAILQGMPCLDAMQEHYDSYRAPDGASAWMVRRFREGDIRRVIPAEHTGLLASDVRDGLEKRFKAKPEETRPWFENLLSATPTLEMGVDIGALSSVLLCSVPPSQASFLQRVGRAGRRDGNAVVVTLADGASPHDLYFYAQPIEMMAGEVTPPGVFLQAAEVLRRQLMAFCIDTWVGTGIPETSLPDKTSPVLDAIDRNELMRFPYNLLDFVQAEGIQLLERLLQMLGDSLTDRVRQRLEDYMYGKSDADGLRVGLLKLLEGLARERKTHKQRAQDLKTRITALKRQPMDEALQEQISGLTQERDKALELARELGARELLGTLTDAGLIPNYAFPEAGVELKSLLWRRRTDGESGEGTYVTLPAERYERPASSALSEFAPENRFYANRRHVEIDQINMQLARAEQWRLCPSCHHMECIDVSGDAHLACPRCGDGLWVNVSQRRTLLRFRQAMANANDARSRIDDSSDDREPKFFVRQLLVDFEPEEVEIAWKLESEQLAFGFEFIRNASFRDINFGERGRTGESFKVADRESVRPGFRLCRSCGMVQTPPNRRRKDENAPAQNHARDCVSFGGDDPANIIDCLYLYREFSSEALRILVPYTASGMDETILQSFMAALQLGLKRRFGGKVDHLRITAQEEPGRDGGPRRHYVLLYDSVPGGTGYLHQLLSHEAETLSQVLIQAFEAIQTCTCNQDPDKDGCYRCLYQYRLGRSMELVSRRSAAQLLGELVASLDRMVRVRSVSDIHINPQFDSILESRFVESLRRLSSVAALPSVRVMQEVVEGHTGYLLEVGNERYWLQMQVDLLTGTGAASRADFVIKPLRESSTRKPIVVFTDGWAFHQGCLREDARKRSALVSSGRYWVWSVTWEDVEAALEGDRKGSLELLAHHARLDANHGMVQSASMRLGVSSAWPSDNAVAGLLRWLGTAPGTGPIDQGTQQKARQAAVIASRMVAAPGAPDMAGAKALLQRVGDALPGGLGTPPANAAVCASRDLAAAVMATLTWSPQWMAGDLTEGYAGLLLDAEQASDAASLKNSWREWLALYNWLQVLPNAYLMEASGVLHGDYAALGDTRRNAPQADVADLAGDDDWRAAFASVLDELREGLLRLRELGVTPPDGLGFELAATTGKVIAEAELAWSTHRLVVLAAHQANQASSWLAEGWKVVTTEMTEWPEAAAAQIKEH